jgi:transcriptional regulator with XRE-family HTH domain
MHDELLGRRLRSERERRLITLESIAANTKISISLLRDLERDEVSSWPSGIFRRSFVRSYAEAIGLDGEEIVREFLERYPDAQQIEANRAALANGDRPKRRSQTGLRLTLADTPRPFSGGRLLENVGARLKAAAWDIGATVGLASLTFLVVGAFWVPFGLVTITYYAFGILILGNSPGVCLFAPRPHDDTPATPTPVQEEGVPAASHLLIG